MKKKVFIIGLDGATFDLIEPWAAAGRLPNFARLLREGSHGRLLSTPDMMSPAAWTSFATGKNPGKHGIFNFMDTVPGTLKIKYLTSRDREGEPLWSTLSRAGRKVVVMNVPMSYPADSVDGCMISGWNAPSINSPGFTHPEGLISDILKKFGQYPLFPTVKKHIMNGRPDLAGEDLRRNIEINTAVSRYLMGSVPWDFFITVFIATDQVQHYFWHYMDRSHPAHDPKKAGQYGEMIYEVYRRCDDFIGEAMGSIDEETALIVMSDHGCGRNHGAVQFLPLWIKEMGFAVEGTPSAGAVQAAKLYTGKVLKKAYHFLDKRLSVRAKAVLNTMLHGLRDRVEAAWRFSAYDWPRTKVYFHYEPRINLKGREPFGSVEPGMEYEKLRELLIAKLYECRDIETGEPVVERVFKGEDLFHGPHMASAPDIVIWWREGIVINGLVSTRADGTEVRLEKKFVEDLRTGNHTPYGIFLARGKDIKPGLELEGASIMDVAPTVLYIMGEPVPKDMDGKVLTEMFTEESLRENPPGFTEEGVAALPSGSLGKDDAVMRQRLKDLGYL